MLLAGRWRWWRTCPRGTPSERKKDGKASESEREGDEGRMASRELGLGVPALQAEVPEQQPQWRGEDDGDDDESCCSAGRLFLVFRRPGRDGKWGGSLRSFLDPTGWAGGHPLPNLH